MRCKNFFLLLLLLPLSWVPVSPLLRAFSHLPPPQARVHCSPEKWRECRVWLIKHLTWSFMFEDIITLLLLLLCSCACIRYTHLHTLHTWESQDSLRCTWWYLMLWLLMWKDWRWGNTTMHCDCTLKCRRKRVLKQKRKTFAISSFLCCCCSAHIQQSFS